MPLGLPRDSWQGWGQQQLQLWPLPALPVPSAHEPSGGTGWGTDRICAELHKGLPGLGTWQRKPPMAGDAGACVGLSPQAAVTPELQPQKCFRSSPRTLPKSQTNWFNCPTSKDYFFLLFCSRGADIYKMCVANFIFFLTEGTRGTWAVLFIAVLSAGCCLEMKVTA